MIYLESCENCEKVQYLGENYFGTPMYKCNYYPKKHEDIACCERFELAKVLVKKGGRV